MNQVYLGIGSDSAGRPSKLYSPIGAAGVTRARTEMVGYTFQEHLQEFCLDACDMPPVQIKVEGGEETGRIVHRRPDGCIVVDDWQSYHHEQRCQLGYSLSWCLARAGTDLHRRLPFVDKEWDLLSGLIHNVLGCLSDVLNSFLENGLKVLGGDIIEKKWMLALDGVLGVGTRERTVREVS